MGEIIYKIEKEHLILDYYCNNEKIASTNAGCITDILNKVNLYNKEYNTLIEQNKQMIDIAKHYEQLQQENKQLSEEYTKVQKMYEDTFRDYQQLKYNWNRLKEYIRKNIIYDDIGMKILDPSPLEDYMQELEQESDSNENN